METKKDTLNKLRNMKNGFVALIATIIISIVLLGMVLGRSWSSFQSRFDSLDSEFKKISLGLAESCAHLSLLKIAQNYYYSPASSGDTLRIGTDYQNRTETCTIVSVATTTPEINGKKTVTIITQGQYAGTFTDIQVTAAVASTTAVTIPIDSNITITSWKQATTTH
jgi:hypothetical protein